MCSNLLFIILPQIFITSHQKKNHEEMDYQFKRYFQCHKNKLPYFLWKSELITELWNSSLREERQISCLILSKLMEEFVKGLGVSKTSKTPSHPQWDNTVELYVMTIVGALMLSGFYAPTELGWESTHLPVGLPRIDPRDHMNESRQHGVRTWNVVRFSTGQVIVETE